MKSFLTVIVMPALFGRIDSEFVLRTLAEQRTSLTVYTEKSKCTISSDFYSLKAGTIYFTGNRSNFASFRFTS